ncbi:MAG: endonuclease [Nitrospira bacterium SM23_35]|nr:MAG: endonuclease [Nitrospira bacterium SM23_35]
MNALLVIYRKLYRYFGPQKWWPGDTPFEVAVGAILTQSTNWSNVENAIQNLKNHDLLSPHDMHGLSGKELALLIRPAGYFNVKAQRLQSFLSFLMNDYLGKMENMAGEDAGRLRTKLLRVHGIGPETADSILLYALDKPVFVIDAYTKRILSRHGIMASGRPYDEFQGLFHDSVRRNVSLYNEYHALFVRAGKTFCRRTNPLCGGCPLNDMLSPICSESV